MSESTFTVKICGLGRLAHLRAAAEAGADLLGIVFVPDVRRRVGVAEAKSMVAAFRQEWGVAHPGVVGLFSDQIVDEVNQIVDEVGLDYVQLCGREDDYYCSKMKARVLKVLHVDENTNREQMIRELGSRLISLEAAGHMAILDRSSKLQPGGLGKPFDWGIACQLTDGGGRFLLAGGLTPKNVDRAVRRAHPCGVDVSSGVETDGSKDVAKMKEFSRVARNAALWACERSLE